MNRRHFIQISAAATLAAHGHLPLLAAERKRPARKKAKAPAKDFFTSSSNIYTEPAAIEPVTGYLTKFAPVKNGAMTGNFTASYSLIEHHGSKAKSRNSIKGSLDVLFSDGLCKTTETRAGRPQNIVKTQLHFTGKLNTVTKWTMNSTVQGIPQASFTEDGTFDGKTMAVRSKSWAQTHTLTNPLISRWSLLTLLSTGLLKSKPLTFDMLDDSTLRPDQTISYTGQIEIPVSGGKTKLDSYTQTGRAIVPTHYLVDSDGRVQLITMDRINWALINLK